MKAKTQLYALVRDLPLGGSYKFIIPVTVEHNLGFHFEVKEIYRPHRGCAELFVDNGSYTISVITEKGSQSLIEAINNLEK